MIQRKILSVEDSFEVRIALEMALTSEGYEVRACADAEAGLQAFSEFKPDLALLDIRMPGMSGIELCRRLREVSNIPIIIFSAVEDKAEKLEAFDAGADDYVVKGTGIDELLVRVAANLRWKRETAPDDEESASQPADAEIWKDDDLANLELQKDRPATPTTGTDKVKPPPASKPRTPRIHIPQYDGEVGTAILVADPNAEARDRLARTLKNSGHSVIETESGLQTLKTVGRYLPWMVMCELVMPDIDGKKMLKLIFEHPRTQGIAVVVVTQKGSPDARDAATRYGALDFIVKPWEQDEIALRIEWAKLSLERRRALISEAA